MRYSHYSKRNIQWFCIQWGCLYTFFHSCLDCSESIIPLLCVWGRETCSEPCSTHLVLRLSGTQTDTHVCTSVISEIIRVIFMSIRRVIFATCCWVNWCTATLHSLHYVCACVRAQETSVLFLMSFLHSTNTKFIHVLIFIGERKSVVLHVCMCGWVVVI